jgi:hypothetical protein
VPDDVPCFLQCLCAFVSHNISLNFPTNIILFQTKTSRFVTQFTTKQTVYSVQNTTVHHIGILLWQHVSVFL